MDDQFDQMRVVDLQAECKRRGLDHRGKKSDLIERLTSAKLQETTESTETQLEQTIEESVDNSDQSSVKIESAEDNSNKTEEEKESDGLDAQNDSNTHCQLVDQDYDDESIRDEGLFFVVAVEVLEIDDENDKTNDFDTSQTEESKIELSDNNETNNDINNDAATNNDTNNEQSRKRRDRTCNILRSFVYFLGSHEGSPPALRRKRSSSADIPIAEAIKFKIDDTNNKTFLNHYNTGLTIDLCEDCLSNRFNTDPALNSIFGCASGSHYIRLSGDDQSFKVGYNLKVTEVMGQLVIGYDVRVGWTMDETNNLLGEGEYNSFAFCANGKKLSKSEASDYGEGILKDDTVTCLAKYENSILEIRFAHNGKIIEDPAFVTEISSGCFMPQLCVRGCSFVVDFDMADSDCPYDGYMWYDRYELRQISNIGSYEKSDHEVLIMIGLPGSGKSHQVDKIKTENPDKDYYVIGFEDIILKQKNIDIAIAEIKDIRYQPLTNNIKDRALRCFNRLLEIAPCRPRNYIIDNCNIYKDVQRKLFRSFKGFKRIAYAIVPNESVHQERLSSHDYNRGSMSEMKGSMNLPSIEDIEDIIFTDLPDEDARKLVEQFNREYSNRRRDRGSRNEDRYRRSPRRGRYSPGNRGRFGNKSDWRGDNRMEPNRFQPRRISPYGRRSAVGYDYGHRVFHDQRIPSAGYFERHKKSMSPGPRGGSRSWAYSPSRGNSPPQMRQRHNVSNDEPSDGFRMRPMAPTAQKSPQQYSNVRGPDGYGMWPRDPMMRPRMPRGPMMPTRGVPHKPRHAENWQLSGKRGGPEWQGNNAKRPQRNWSEDQFESDQQWSKQMDQGWNDKPADPQWSQEADLTTPSPRYPSVPRRPCPPQENWNRQPTPMRYPPQDKMRQQYPAQRMYPPQQSQTFRSEYPPRQMYYRQQTPNQMNQQGSWSSVPQANQYYPQQYPRAEVSQPMVQQTGMNKSMTQPGMVQPGLAQSRMTYPAMNQQQQMAQAAMAHPAMNQQQQQMAQAAMAHPAMNQQQPQQQMTQAHHSNMTQQMHQAGMPNSAMAQPTMLQSALAKPMSNQQSVSKPIIGHSAMTSPMAQQMAQQMAQSAMAQQMAQSAMAQQMAQSAMAHSGMSRPILAQPTSISQITTQASQQWGRPVTTQSFYPSQQPIVQTTTNQTITTSAVTSQQQPLSTTTTATTTPHLIDEPTAYAGYLSAGYDQATAKMMATAYVQQQQQYYQWQQQWAAAQAAAKSAQQTTTPQQK